MGGGLRKRSLHAPVGYYPVGRRPTGRVMRARTTLPQQRALETRDRIVRAAYRVFARRGYGQATLDDIALEAGTSKGALYHHFSSKEDIFRSLLDDHTVELDAMLEAVGAASSFREIIEKSVAIWLAHCGSDPHFVPLSLELRVQATRDEWARTLVRRFYEDLRGLIAGTVGIAQRHGIVRSDLDSGSAAVLLFGLIDTVAVQSAIDPEKVRRERVESALVDAVERLLGVTGTPGAAAKAVRAMRRDLVEFLRQTRQRLAAQYESLRI